MEDLRQKDIFTKFSDKWISYVGGIQEQCLEKYKRDKNIDMCSERVGLALGIDMNSVNQRVSDAAIKC